jgi:hypothetical protein
MKPINNMLHFERGDAEDIQVVSAAGWGLRKMVTLREVDEATVKDLVYKVAGFNEGKSGLIDVTASEAYWLGKAVSAKMGMDLENMEATWGDHPMATSRSQILAFVNEQSVFV